MVSLPTPGTNLRLTASWATSRTVQRTRPAGGSLHTIAIIRCFRAVIEHGRCAGPLSLVERRFQTALLVTVADLANGLWSERNNAGNPRCAGAFGQLQQRQGAQDEPNLLHTAA
jgi:hypothetical protein